MRCRLNKRREKKLRLPPEPKDMAFEIPEQLKYLRHGTDREKKILLADSMERNPREDPRSRILMFGDPDAKEWTHLSKHLYIDGTFNVRPKFPTQTRKCRRQLPDTLEEALEGDEEENEEEEVHRARPKFAEVRILCDLTYVCLTNSAI
jgi:hypothetical protein